MSTNSILSKIRQEIKRLRKEIKDEKDPLAPNQKAGYLFALTDMESFLDTLSKEPVQKFNTDKLQEIAKPATPHKKPTPEDRAKFMKELHEYAESKKPDKSLEEAARHSEILTYPMPEDGDIEKVMKVQEARIFHEIGFKAGAEWQASQMPMPEDTVLFQKGVAEGRRLEREDMLKDAEECELYWDGDFLAIDLNMRALGYSERDKVKVIVLKDESK